MRLASCLVLLALVTASPAWAIWPHDLYSGNLPVCTAAGTQITERTIADGAAGAFVVWADSRSTVPHIYAQHVSAAGVNLWAANGVLVCGAAVGQSVPALCSDGAGGVVVSWTDSRSGSGFDVYAQRLNAAGVPQWTADGVPLGSGTGDQSGSEMLSDGGGGAIVVWQDTRSGVLDIYAQRVNTAGVVQWAANGAPVCTATAQQTGPRIASDAAGGAIITWNDFRLGNVVIYAQRLSPSGAPLWTVDGIAVGTPTGAPMIYADLVADGSGGAVVAWQDGRPGAVWDIYAQRLSALGAQRWAPSGNPVCTAAGDQKNISMVADGAGGAIIGWADARSGVFNVYAQRIDGSGAQAWTPDGVALYPTGAFQMGEAMTSDGLGGAVITWYDYRASLWADLYAQRLDASGVARWTPGGAALCLADGNQLTPAIASDGSGGAVVFWQDARLGGTNIYAQRIERYGQLAPEPSIASVRDVRNDQGGFVKVSWNASWLDAYPGYAVYDYRLWRSVPAAALAARAAKARTIVSDPDRAAADGLLFARPDGATDYAWEAVTTQLADGLPLYSFVAATLSDSMASGNPKTAFMIEARTGASPTVAHWFSPADSGYSADNLAPATPAPFTGTYAGGTTTLLWNHNTEPDLAGYRLYRGTSTAFVPGSGNLVAQLSESNYADPAGAPYIYKLTAIDVHGNESPSATLVPGGTADVGSGLPVAFAFAAPSPNPASRAVELRFALPASHAARLAIYDASGRVVRALAQVELAAGWHSLAWDLRDDAGRAVAAGLYFARLEAGGTTLVRRLVAAP